MIKVHNPLHVHILNTHAPAAVKPIGCAPGDHLVSSFVVADELICHDADADSSFHT